jgi:hypothetical protein
MPGFWGFSAWPVGLKIPAKFLGDPVHGLMAITHINFPNVQCFGMYRKKLKLNGVRSALGAIAGHPKKAHR